VVVVAVASSAQRERLHFARRVLASVGQLLQQFIYRALHRQRCQPVRVGRRAASRLRRFQYRVTAQY
jgi:hypothetical protein